MERLKRLFSPGLIVAILALVFALGGTAVAERASSSKVAPNSISSRHIKDGSIRAKDINPNTLATLMQANQQLTPGDPVPGPAGPKGDKGDPGQDGVLGYQIFTSKQDFGPGGIGGAWCGAPDVNTSDQGWVVIGGGAKLSATDVNAGFVVVSGWPNTDDPLNPGWNVQLNKPPNKNPGEVELYVVCAKRP